MPFESGDYFPRFHPKKIPSSRHPRGFSYLFRDGQYQLNPPVSLLGTATTGATNGLTDYIRVVSYHNSPCSNANRVAICCQGESCLEMNLGFRLSPFRVYWDFPSLQEGVDIMFIFMASKFMKYALCQKPNIYYALGDLLLPKGILFGV